MMQTLIERVCSLNAVLCLPSCECDGGGGGSGGGGKATATATLATARATMDGIYTNAFFPLAIEFSLS